MSFVERKREEASLYNINEIFHLDLSKILMSSVYGRAFLEDSQGKLLGCFSVDNYVMNKGITKFDHPPVLSTDKDLAIQAKRIASQNIFYGILPVVDAAGKIVKFISATSYLWQDDMLNALTKLAYFKDKGMILGKYFSSRKLKRVALWGCNSLSLTLALTLKEEKSIELLGIFENQCNKAFVKDDILNYPVEISFVESMEDLHVIGVEEILVCDWTMRHAGNVIDFAKVDYAVHWLKSQDLYLFLNASMYKEAKAFLVERGVAVYAVRVPTEAEMGLKDRKNDRLTEDERFEYFSKETGYPRKSQELLEFNNARQALAKAVVKIDGGVYFQDFASKDFNYMQGRRFVPNVKAKDGNCKRVFLLGPCIVSGLFNKDDQTLGYYLQEILNAKKDNYEVVPLGMPNDADRFYYFQALKRENPRSGDVVIYLEESFRNQEYELDALPVFKECFAKHGQDFYYDLPVHCGKAGAEAMAKFLYEKCLASPAKLVSFTQTADRLTKDSEYHSPPPPYAGNPELMRYKGFLKANKIHHQLVVGAIVMNANPFTLGHRYLVDQAIRQTDYLYIFVVEEDKSFFTFADRLKMVKLGTQDLKNVKVLPSGKFIISSLTFSAYFDKSNLQGNTVDTSLDLETFARQIAPCLDISVRFVGEEPFDLVTRQYNHRMKEILPHYGIELREIPRKEGGGEAISASRVRKYLQEQQWEKLQAIVPETTFAHLRELYRQQT